MSDTPTPRVYAFSENIGRAIAAELRQFLEETKDDPVFRSDPCP